MTICYFGDFDKSYSRNHIIINGLEKNGVKIVFCHTSQKGVGKYFDLWIKYVNLSENFNVIIVGYSNSRLLVPFARLISGKKVIWDAFYSLYDSYVFDRKLVGSRSIKAGLYWFADWLACKCAHVVVLDTEEHIKYMSKEFRTRKNKFRRIWIGAQDDIFKPLPLQTHKNFQVVFHGFFIPLQGIEYILKAAKILEGQNIDFIIIGSGQESPKMIDLSRKIELKNTIFFDRISKEDLATKIASADVCLGIFGNTEKAKRVIPNKVYECLSMQKPVITGDTPAIRELFNENDLILVPMADPQAIANAVIRLRDNPDLRNSIAESGYNKLKKNAIPEILGAQIKQIIYEFKKE